MKSIAVRLLLRERGRTVITMIGTGTLLLLILFLAGIYQGVKHGSTGFIEHSTAQIWACQKNSNNLLRSSSFLPSPMARDLAAAPGVQRVESILRLITTANIHGKTVTAFIFGIPSNNVLSRPPVLRGTPSPGPREIILDQSTTKKYDLAPGDTIRVNEQVFTVAGVSYETNATVAQFSFIALPDAERILGLRNISSFFLLSVDANAPTHEVLAHLRQGFPSLAFYSKDEFIKTNLDEMGTGVLPILWTITFFGLLAGGAIVSLLLYASVQEHREDYALVKALGMSQWRLALVVIRQALLISFGGFIVALCGYAACSPILSMLAPEISVDVNMWMVAGLLGIAWILGCAGSFASVSKLSSVYPTEVFRA
jgi:putative ABC transport system permease protein